MSASSTPDMRPGAMANGFEPSMLQSLPAAERELVERRQRALGPAYRLFYERPVVVDHAKGVHIYDPEGNEYLDVYNNVPCVGHAHPHVNEAIARQLERVNTNTRYLQDGVVDYAERLLSTFPDELGNVMFTCTGSEANDLALRVARWVTGGTGVIVTANAYHGVTTAIAAISPSLGANVPLGSYVRTIPAPDALRIQAQGFDFDAYMADAVRAAIADLQRHGVKVAAFIADGAFASDGIHPNPVGWLHEAARLVREAGGLYIADEVQPGFGRLGDGWWGFARHGVVPDIVTMGKPMGNGIPIAAAVFRPDLLVDFGYRVRYFNTFGGNSVSIAAAGAVLDVIESEQLIANAASVGRQLLEGIRSLTASDEQVAEVRGSGLFIGVELVTDRESLNENPQLSAAIVNRLRERRVLISSSGPKANVLKVRPPMAFRSADADRLLSELDIVLGQLRSTGELH
ncbi:aspartate aminotransferase family protein [Bifidobacterium tibiigranuli]|uniref:aspartate aminotransferase family protein n=1 Tax=Bifidobacterium tibiigranuli TaxID=2172043 RepID=UPI002357FBE1|nr:aspartate aminotransferase family protein [Bifidobacterium tibiigranuli]MCI1211056.1 aspartate aminotransferase family protein [Bifidobacterium tibiigranuli]MCI1221821.1 aspartate aminotransferase family protein [Bifidobacterium tibiigranuli]